MPSPWLLSDHSLTVLSLLADRKQCSLSCTYTERTGPLWPNKKRNFISREGAAVRLVKLHMLSTLSTFASAYLHFARAISYFKRAIPYFTRAIPYFARLLIISHMLFPVSVLPVKVWSLTCCRLNLCPILPFTSVRNKSPNRLTTRTS